MASKNKQVIIISSTLGNFPVEAEAKNGIAVHNAVHLNRKILVQDAWAVSRVIDGHSITPQGGLKTKKEADVYRDKVIEILGEYTMCADIKQIPVEKASRLMYLSMTWNASMEGLHTGTKIGRTRRDRDNSVV